MVRRSAVHPLWKSASAFRYQVQGCSDRVSQMELNKLEVLDGFEPQVDSILTTMPQICLMKEIWRLEEMV